MQDSLKVENTATHQCGVHTVSGTTQALLLAKFSTACKKLGKKRHSHNVPKTLCDAQYIIKYR